jgi:hypothetical protein
VAAPVKDIDKLTANCISCITRLMIAWELEVDSCLRSFTPGTSDATFLKERVKRKIQPGQNR